MKPLVSIIIPTYNRAHLIGETLESVVNQSYTNWAKDKQKGANACRNYGFKISKGNIINWLDSDDLLIKNHLQLHVEVKIDYI